jgi:tape measure domain-containing protein
MAQAASLWVKLGLSDKEFDQGLKRAERSLKRFGDRLSTLGSRLTTGFSAPLALASGGAIKLAADLEQTKIAFEVMTGSAEKASRMVENLQKMGAKTPYESKDLLESAKTLMLFGVQTEKVEGMLQMLGDVASGSSDKLKSLSLAFAQVQSTGRLTGQDLLQMINAGFNPLQIISEKTGKSMAELKEQMSKGAISADAVTQAFKVATSEGGRFFGMMDKQSKTTLGRFSTFMDNVKLALTNLGNALLPFANKILDMLVPVTEALSNLADWFSQLPTPIQNAIAAVTAFAIALGPMMMILGKVVGAFSALPGLIRLVTTGLPGLATAFTPFLVGGAIVVGLGAIVALFTKIRENARLAQMEISKTFNMNDLLNESKRLEKEIAKKEQEIWEEANPSIAKRLWGNLTRNNTFRPDWEGLRALQNRYKEVQDQIKAISAQQTPGLDLKIEMPEFDFSTLTGVDDDEIKRARKELTDKIKALTLSEVEYQKWALDEEKKDFENTYKGKQDILDLYAEYYDLKMKDIEKANETWAQKTEQIVADTAHGMEQSLSSGFFDVVKGNFDSLGDYFQNFLDSILRSWTNAMAQMMTHNIMGGGGAGFFTNMFGGGKAAGGPVVGGKTYIVGEKGPELFTPNSSGTIIPNNALGGANVTVQVVNPPGIPLKAKTSQPKFDGKQMIVSVMLEAINNNIGGIRDALGTVR